MATDARGHTVPTGSDFAARKSLTDLSLSISDIPARASAAAMGLLISDLAGAGVAPSASRPVYCYRSDVGTLYATTDGSTWTQVTPGVCNAGSVSPVSSWSPSSLTLRRVGDLVFCDGRLLKASGTISSGRNDNIAVIPAGWLPSADIYTSAGWSGPVSEWVSGATNPLLANSTMYISTSSGNVGLYVDRTSTEMRVSCHWRIA